MDVFPRFRVIIIDTIPVSTAPIAWMGRMGKNECGKGGGTRSMWSERRGEYEKGLTVGMKS